MNTNQIDELSMIEERQKQLIAFLTSLETIRWRFISAFGVGAVIGLFLLKSNKSSVEIQLISSFFIIFVSLASLVIQVRIFGLINSIWYKIVSLQELQFKLMDINNNISELTKKIYLKKTKNSLEHVLYCLNYSIWITKLNKQLAKSLIL